MRHHSSAPDKKYESDHRPSLARTGLHLQAPEASGGPAGRGAGLNPRAVVAALIIALLLHGVVIAWRYAESRNHAPRSYYEFQLARWQQQLSANPKDPLIWATIGGLYQEMGDINRAEKAFGRALTYDPQNVSAMVFRARRARADGDVETARVLFAEALDRTPPSGRSVIFYEIGDIEERSGDIPAAIAAYEESISHNSTYFNAYERLAFLYEQSGDAASAIEAASLALQFVGTTRPDLIDLVNRLGGDTDPPSEGML